MWTRYLGCVLVLVLSDHDTLYPAWNIINRSSILILALEGNFCLQFLSVLSETRSPEKNAAALAVILRGLVWAGSLLSIPVTHCRGEM